MLNLRRVDLATDEDKKWKIDKWATLFKAKTWEDLRMIAAQDEEMTIASKALYKIRINMLAYGLRHMRTSSQKNACWSIV